MSDDKPIIDRLERLAQVAPSAEATRRALEQVRAALEQQSQAQREFSKSRRYRVLMRAAASIVVLAGVVGLASWLAFPGGSTALAFSVVQDSVAATRWVEAVQTTYVDHQPTRTSKSMTRSDGIERWENPDGYTIIDRRQNKELWVDTKRRVAMLMQGSNIPQCGLYDPFHKFPTTAAEEVAPRKVNGRTCPGYLVQIPSKPLATEVTVWVDSQTHLPVLLEGKRRDEKGHEFGWTASDMIYHDEPAADLFSFEPPMGYKVVNRGSPELPPSTPDEQLMAPVVDPSLGLGPAHFGMSREEIIQALGPPDDVPEGNKNRLIYYSRGYSLSLSPKGLVSFECFGQKLVRQRVREFRGKTSQGIGIGSSQAEIERAYGEPASIDDVNLGSIVAISYTTPDISFRLLDDKVVDFLVKAPRKPSK